MRISDWSADVCSSDLVGDGVGLEVVLGHGDGEPRVAFMCEEDRLSGGGEEHGIGLPMACLLAGGNAVGAVVDRGTIGVARPAALGTPSPLVFGAREVEAPAPVVGAFELGIDEAVDALVADDLMARFAGEAASHLFGGTARRAPVGHLPPQGIHQTEGRRAG